MTQNTLTFDDQERRVLLAALERHAREIKPFGKNAHHHWKEKALAKDLEDRVRLA